MIYRIFGKTGLAMPLLSCGLMRSMFSWQDMEGSRIPDHRQHELAEVEDSAFNMALPILRRPGDGVCQEKS